MGKHEFDETVYEAIPVKSFPEMLESTFPDAQIEFLYGDQYANVRTQGRDLTIDYDEMAEKIGINFHNASGDTSYTAVGKELQKGSKEFLESLLRLAKEAKEAGLGISAMGSTSKRDRVYSRGLKRLGLEPSYEEGRTKSHLYRDPSHPKFKAKGAEIPLAEELDLDALFAEPAEEVPYAELVDMGEELGLHPEQEHMSDGGVVPTDPLKHAKPGEKDTVDTKLESGEVVVPKDQVAALKSLVTTRASGEGTSVAKSPGSMGLAGALENPFFTWNERGPGHWSDESGLFHIKHTTDKNDTENPWDAWRLSRLENEEDVWGPFIGGAHGSLPDAQRFAEEYIQKKIDEAGEVDWRPNESIPEDYYAMAKGGTVPPSKMSGLGNSATALGGENLHETLGIDPEDVNPGDPTVRPRLTRMPGTTDGEFGPSIGDTQGEDWSLSASQIDSGASPSGSTSSSASAGGPQAGKSGQGGRRRIARSQSSGFLGNLAGGIISNLIYASSGAFGIRQGIEGDFGSMHQMLFGGSQSSEGGGISGMLSELLGGESPSSQIAEEGSERLIEVLEKLLDAIKALTDMIKKNDPDEVGIKSDGTFKPSLGGGGSHGASIPDSRQSNGPNFSDMLKTATDTITRIIAML